MRLNTLILTALIFAACQWLGVANAQPQDFRIIQSNLGPPFVELRASSAPILPEEPESAERELLKKQFAAGRYEEAVASAQAMLQMALAEFGDGDSRIVPALIDLGTSQHYAENYQAAQNAYTQAVELLGVERDTRDPRLARPLHGLGVAQYAAGNYAQAVESLQRAVFVTRVNDGLNSLEQLKYYDALTEADLAMGLYEDAIARQKARIAVLKRATGSSSPESIAAVEQAARLYRRMNRYFEERDIRRRQLRTIEKSKGYGDISLAPILIELAATYRLSFEVDLISVGPFDQIIIPIGDRAAVGDLERALDILDEHPDIPSLDLRVAALIELGDFHLTFDESPRANRYYNLAYKLLEDAGETAQIQATFSEPVPVFLPRPESAPEVGGQPAAGLPKGYVLLEFNLGVTGRPRNVQALELEPASIGIMRVRGERAMRGAKFRPAFGPNGPEKRSGLRYKLEFNYVPTNASTSG
mgnify:CR=1 FL=1